MTDQTTDDDAKQVRPFAAVLQDIQGGTVAKLQKELSVTVMRGTPASA